MKKILRILLINMLAVGVTAYLVPGISYTGGVVTVVILAVVFALINLFVKPAIKLLALPVEIITLGLFSMIINAGLFILMERLVPDLKISGFYFGGFDSTVITLNSFYVPAWGTAAIGSLIIGTICTFFYWITD